AHPCSPTVHLRSHYMPARRLFAAASLALTLGACARDQSQQVTAPASTGPSFDKKGPDGFRTSQPAQAEALVHGASLIPILTTGDIIHGPTLPWAPTPDGLGAYRTNDGSSLFANHEITASGVTSSNGGTPFLFSRVSHLTLADDGLSVLAGNYAEDGSGGY